MKKCKSCFMELPYERFTKSKNVKDGYENKCKDCRREQRKKHSKECIECEREFETTYKKAIYCSIGCKPQHKKQRVKVFCFICEEEKEVVPSRLKDYKNFYCSETCKNEGYKVLYSGKNHHNYNTITSKCDYCDVGFSRWSSQIEKYDKSYCSITCKNEDYKVRFSGENNPNYNHKRSDDERVRGRNINGYPEWRRKVFKRDEFTCQICKDDKGGNLVAHHILNYSEHIKLRTDINNATTMCVGCHKEFHDKFGYSNNNKIINFHKK